MVTKIEITFPVDVDPSEANLRLLDRAAARICADYELTHPDRVMWPFGHGNKMTVNPLVLSDDEPIPFDDSVYHIECAEREKYEDHKEFKLNHTSYPSEEMFQDIADFHAKFGLAYDGRPRRLPDELGPFRVGFMAEELAEYISPNNFDHQQVVTMIKSYDSIMGDQVPLEKKLDALVDLVYVALGTAYLHGFAFDEAWRRVHEANMKKVRAERKEDSLRGSTFDVVKPPGWTAPDLSDLVELPHVFVRPEQDEDFAP